jgi:uncharacterized protein YcfJ
MKRWLMGAMGVVALGATLPAWADLTLYEFHDYGGRAVTTQHAVGNFRSVGFNDTASSVVIKGEPWEVCDAPDFGGKCMVLMPGSYRALGEMGLNNRVSSVRPARREPTPPPPPPPPPRGEITFFGGGGFTGPAVKMEQEAPDLKRYGFNNRASSVIVQGERWELCERPGFSGRCVVLRPGMYPSLLSMGLSNNLSSARPIPPGVRVEEMRYAPAPQVVYDWRRRPQERLQEVNVVSAQAVYTAGQQRCWVERERVVREPNVGGAVVGGVIGGILGHEIAGKGNRDLGTAGGAFAGAVIGANVGGQTTAAPVQRCTTVPAHGRPDYWEVTYVFNGVEHRAQTTFQPGPTITVNDQGEPKL